MKTLKEVVNEIVNLKSREDVLDYCNNLPDYYYRESYNISDYENGTTIFSLISGDSSYDDDDIYEYDGDDYIQILCSEHTRIIGINLLENKLITYDYHQWDDGDCSEIVKLDEYKLNF